jgi:hypothetical protein
LTESKSYWRSHLVLAVALYKSVIAFVFCLILRRVAFRFFCQESSVVGEAFLGASDRKFMPNSAHHFPLVG